MLFSEVVLINIKLFLCLKQWSTAHFDVEIDTAPAFDGDAINLPVIVSVSLYIAVNTNKIMSLCKLFNVMRL